MEDSKRQITKIARDVSRYTQKKLKTYGIGPSELDVLHVVRKNDGVTQKFICDKCGFDKAAVARIIVSLEKKQLVTRKDNPNDKRSSLIFSTNKDNALKDTKSQIEAYYYSWLFNDLDKKEKENFLNTLNKLYEKSKKESKNEFNNIKGK